MSDIMVCVFVAIVAFGLGRMSGRRQPAQNPYGVQPLPAEGKDTTPIVKKRPLTGERLFMLIFILGWIVAWSAGISLAFKAFWTAPNLFIGGWLVAAVAGWFYAAFTIWKLVTGQTVHGRGGREI